MPTPAATLKRIERGWRRLWIGVITRLVRRAGTAPPPDWAARPHSVLFLRHDRIGDMILSTGLLRVIARSHPTISLAVLASPTNAPVLREDPNVRAVIVFDRTKPLRYLETVRRLRRARYDAVIDCMPTAPSLTTLLLILASGARHRIGVAGRGHDEAFTLLAAPRHDVHHIVDQLGALAAPFGVDPRTADFSPRLHLEGIERAAAAAIWGAHAPEGEGRRLLVNVSSGRSFRRWPDERFVEAIRHVLGRQPDVTVLVIGAPDERERAAQIARAAGATYVATTTLREALALVDTADVVFTPDTGLAHAASALGRPAVVMHIRGTAVQWGLYRSPGREVSSPDASLASLFASTVIDALDCVLADDAVARRNASRATTPAQIGHFVR
jgi:ADP-heptose:LPS heptosyltransferase